MMRILFFVFWVTIGAWAIAQRLEARTLVENRFSNVHVDITQVNGVTEVFVRADIENGVTAPRRVIFNITNQLSAGQVTSATNAYLFVLGQLGSQESVPTPTPTATSTTATKTPTPVPTVTP